MSWVAAAVVGTAVVGGYVNSQASGRAADAQEAASDRANATQNSMYNQNRIDQTPYRNAGTGALSSLSNNDFMNNWQQDPGYQFRLNEGNKAINAAASARGNVQGGAALKALTRYGQDYATNEYSNVYNRNYSRLSQLANLGQNAAAQTGASGQNYANQVSQNTIGAGNAQAANYINQGNNLSNVLNTGANAYAGYQAQNNLGQTSGGGTNNYFSYDANNLGSGGIKNYK